jgi:glycyl-tRNA synthetase beta subunit
VRAAIAFHSTQPAVFDRCLAALIKADEAVLQDLAEHTKRMIKISNAPAESVNKSLLEAPAEKILWSVLSCGRTDIASSLEKSDFDSAISHCLKFVDPIKNFFDSVMVNDEREDVKANRHCLLKETVSVLALVADFSLIEKKSS